jgi:hypothetical protein
MQENIQQVSDTFHDEKDVERVSQNATEKIREAVIGELSGDANLQKVQEASLLSNVQKIGANGFRKQQQGVGEGGYADNYQGLDFSGFNLAPPNLVCEIRLDDLQKNIGQVHEKLNQFFPKPNGKSVLAAEPREKFVFNKAPYVQSTPDAAALNVPVSKVEPQNKVDLKNNWPELNFQPVAIAPSVRPARKPLASDGLAFQDATAAIEANQAKQPSLTNQVTEVSVKASADETVQLDKAISSLDGSTKYLVVQRSKATSGSAPVRPVRSLKYFGVAAAVVIAMPMGVYGYGAIYPSLNCQGQTQQSRFWTTPGESGSTSVMQENKMTEMHKLEIRRGEVYLDNHRFPLYKELNRDNHFAAQTPVGFHGSYTSHAVESMSYAFEFNAQTQALRVFSQSSGMRFIDGEVGQMRVVAVFAGQCSKPWF